MQKETRINLTYKALGLARASQEREDYGHVVNVIDKPADIGANCWYGGPTQYDSSMLPWKKRMEVLEEQPEDWVDRIYP